MRRVKKLHRACRYSRAGLKAAFVHEPAFRKEIYLLIVLIPLGYWLAENGVERALLIGSLLLVPIVELLNSGLEAVVDRVGLESHELSRRAKDMGSAAVFVCNLLVGVVWFLVLAPSYL
jgi:diacylglycerol kinase (ATP)